MSYDLMTTTEVQNLSDSQKAAKRYPITNFVWVKTTDIDGVNYVTGSEGRPKIITEYADLDKTMVASISTFKYQDTFNPAKPTEVIFKLG